jgi:hypothetical protein
MAQSSRRTGPRAASAAGRTLSDTNATRAERSAAASALAQVGTPDQTGRRAASAAGKTLSDTNATRAERSAAASALSQTPSRKKK